MPVINESLFNPIMPTITLFLTSPMKDYLYIYIYANNIAADYVQFNIVICCYIFNISRYE